MRRPLNQIHRLTCHGSKLPQVDSGDFWLDFGVIVYIHVVCV